MGIRYGGNDYREFLRQVLQDRNLLQRDLAQMMERSPAWASQILSGKRRLQRGRAEKIADVLSLDDAERWELLRLVDLATSPMPPMPRRPLPRVTEPVPALERWYVGALFELARCDQYEPDPLWIAAALRPRIEIEEAKEAMILLRDHGLLGPDFRVPTEGATPPRRGIRSSDRSASRVLQLSLDALRAAPPNERSHHTGSVALSEEAYEELLLTLNRTIAQLIAAPDGDTPNRVYQVSVSAFPISLFSDAEAHPSEIED